MLTTSKTAWSSLHEQVTMQLTSASTSVNPVRLCSRMVPSLEQKMESKSVAHTLLVHSRTLLCPHLLTPVSKSLDNQQQRSTVWKLTVEPTVSSSAVPHPVQLDWKILIWTAKPRLVCSTLRTSLEMSLVRSRTALVQRSSMVKTQQML